MDNTHKDNHFDAIVVGSGTCGATIARELSRQQKKVLILERGGNTPLKESFFRVASVADAVSVSDKFKAGRVITTGGSTALYFAVAQPPPLDSFLTLGVDLSDELEAVQRELPLATLPDELLGEQAIRLRESATELGHAWKKNLMLIDQSRCGSGYSYKSKWKAKSYVEEAIAEGATLINRATVVKVLVEKKKAIGVEYKLSNRLRRSERCRVYGTKIILAAGSLASPMILRNSGIKDVGNRGFFCDPGFAVFGFVPSLKGKDNFPGSMSADFEDGVALGDANICRTFFRLTMIGAFKFKHLFSYSQSIAVGVKVKDGLGGGIDSDGRYYKEFPKEVTAKLQKGREEAERVLKNAGAKDIFETGHSATHVGGVIRIQEHVDETLQTAYRNLHVCDGSLIPENVSVTPVLTLVCLGKYLAKHLLSSFGGNNGEQ